MKANLIEHISVEILTIISQLTPKQFDLLLNSLFFFYFFTFVSHQHRNFYVVECQCLSYTFSFIIQNTAAHCATAERQNICYKFSAKKIRKQIIIHQQIWVTLWTAPIKFICLIYHGDLSKPRANYPQSFRKWFLSKNNLQLNQLNLIISTSKEQT